MIYRCDNCQRFLAEIKDINNFIIKNRNTIVNDKNIIMTCRCGTKKEIIKNDIKLL